MFRLIRRLFARCLVFFPSKSKSVVPSTTTSVKPLSSLAVEALEPRILYSAAPVEAPAADNGDSGAAESAPSQSQEAAPVSEAAPAPVAAPVPVAASAPSASEGESSVSSEPAVSLVDVSNESAPLNQQTLDAVADAARQRWIDTGISDEQIAALDAIEYEIANIGGNHLSKANGFTVTIDDDAAGSGGWFVDSTPGLDEEFLPTANFAFTAVPDSAAADRFDLLSAVLHEQGHVLGIDHAHDGTNADLMADFLGSGKRLLPEAGQAHGAVPGSISGDAFLDAQFIRASSDSLGTEGNADSLWPVISADGLFVAFASEASNLVPGDTNGVTDVFVKNLTTGEITLASSNAAGNPGNAESGNLFGDSYIDISGDGRFVTFRSNASNLVSGDTNGEADFFVKDLSTGTQTLIRVQAPHRADDLSISENGRYVVFESYFTGAMDIVVQGVFRKDLVSGQTIMVNQNSYRPSISADGNMVTFQTYDGNFDVFVKNITSGSVTQINTASDGTPGNGDSEGAEISADGNFVAFYSSATNLVPDDTNGIADLFVKNLSTGGIVRANTDALGTQATTDTVIYDYKFSISADGSLIAFISNSPNLVPGDDWYNTEDLFLKDLNTGAISRPGITEDIFTFYPDDVSMSADGSLFAFNSRATFLVPNDNNDSSDIFILDPNSTTSPATYTTEVSNDIDGNLLITDIDGGDSHDRLTVRTEGDQLIISDPDNTVGFTAAGAVQISPHEVHVSLFSFSGDVILRTLEGDDQIYVGDLSGLPMGIIIDSGGGEDFVEHQGQVALTGGGALSYAADRIRLYGRNSPSIHTEDGSISLNASSGGVELINSRLTISGLGSVNITGFGSVDASSRDFGILADRTSIDVLGDGSITLNGTAFGSNSKNNGISFSKGSLDARGSGGINITGTSSMTSLGSVNHGLSLFAEISSGTGDINITGIGGSGSSSNYGYIGGGSINSQGSVNIVGVAHQDTTKSGNVGIHFRGTISAGVNLTLDGTGGGGDSKNVGVNLSNVDAEAAGTLIILGAGRATTTKVGNQGVVTDRTFLDAASISITGTAGNGTNDNRGVSLRRTTVDATTGPVQITGTGGTGINRNVGVALNQAPLKSSGGSIQVTGTAQASTTGSNNRGIDASNSGFDGTAVTLNGTGGGGKSNNEGIRVNGGDGIIATAGAINISGAAQAATTGVNNTGVYFKKSSSSATNGVNIMGTGGGGTNSNMGVYANSRGIDGAGGGVQITGSAHASTTGSNNAGIVLIHHGVTGTSVNLTGIGGGGKNNNQGVVNTATARHVPVGPSSGLLSATVGDLVIRGTAQANTTGSGNSGVYLKSPPLEAANGIDILGIGGGGNNKNYGVFSDSQRFDAGSGSVQVDGRANAGTTGSDNAGAVISYHRISGSSISLTGVGGGGKNSNTGLRTNGDEMISSTGGITLTGTAQSITTGSKNAGVDLQKSDPDSATGIDIIGTGGGGKSQNYGVFGFSMVNHAGSGDVSITGTAQATTTGANNIGVLLKNSNAIGNAVSIDGTGGGGSNNNMGVQLKGIRPGGSSTVMVGMGTGFVRTNVGSATIHGTAQSATTGSGNTGVWIQTNPITSTNGIDIAGTGGGGKNNNYGTYLANDLDAGSGNASITGSADGSTSGSNNNGLYLRQAYVEADGNITVAGDGGNGKNTNVGALLFNVGLLGDGTVNLSGVAHADTSGNSNRGVYGKKSIIIEGSEVNVNALGGGGKNSNDGLYLLGDIRTTTGNIMITAEARASTTGTRNSGVQMTGDLRSTAGAVNIEGTGGGGTDRNHGIYLLKSDTNLQNGEVTITGNARDADLRTLNVGTFLVQSQVFGTNTTITGTGGNGASSNMGIILSNSGIASHSTTRLIGIAHANNVEINNHGIYGSRVAIGGSNIFVDGTGGGGSKLNHGIFMTKLSATPGAVTNGVAGGGVGSLDLAGDPFP